MSVSHKDSQMMRAIYACDIGSTQQKGSASPNFAWVRVEPETGSKVIGSSDIRTLATILERDLRRGYSVALGIEAPLFIPVPMSADDLGRGRRGEGSHSFAASVGATVAVLGMHQAAWLLRRLFESCGDMCTFTLNCQEWPPTTSRPVIFCWEAFVSGSAHGTTHVQDAATAAMAFLEHEHSLAAIKGVTADRPFSLIGAVALWSGWITDHNILHKSAVVIKPATPCQGKIEDASSWL